MPFRPYQTEPAGSRQPQHIGNVVGELFARRGYGRVLGTAAMEQAWRQAVGDELAVQTRVGTLRRGTLEIVVSSSLLSQELTFQKTQLLARMQSQLPPDTVRDFRFRVGSVGKASQ